MLAFQSRVLHFTFETATYITRRFLRLFPAFGFCLLVGFFISPWQYDLVHLPWSNAFPWVHHQSDLALLHQQHAFGNILTHLVMLHGLIPGCYLPDSTGAFLGVGWSISTEWQFYLIAPLALWLARKKLGLILVACIVIAFTNYFSYINYFKNFVNERPSLILFHLKYFFIGGLSYFLWNKLHAISASTLLPKIQGMVILGLGLSFCVNDPVLPLWIFIFSSLCQMTINPAAFDAHLISSTLCSKVSLFLGRISYSIYLAHWPIAIITLKFLNSFWNLHFSRTHWALFVITFLIGTSLITIIAAHFLYLYIEKPAINWGKRIFNEA